MSGDAAIGADGMPDITGVGFDHLQFYVDAIKPADEYKAIEQKLNAFAKEAKSSGNATLGTSQGVDLTKAKWWPRGGSGGHTGATRCPCGAQMIPCGHQMKPGEAQ